MGYKRIHRDFTGGQQCHSVVSTYMYDVSALHTRNTHTYISIFTQTSRNEATKVAVEKDTYCKFMMGRWLCNTSTAVIQCQRYLKTFM